MKEKHFTAGFFLATLLGTKTKKQRSMETVNEVRAAHTLLLRHRPKVSSCINPVYRSVTACIY